MNTDDNTKKSSDPLNSFPPEEGKQLYSKSNGIDGQGLRTASYAVDRTDSRA